MEGFLGGSLVLSVSAILPAVQGVFTAIPSPNSSQTLDALVISFTGNDSSYNIDNIMGFAAPITSVVPEASSLAVAAVGLACIAVYSGFRRYHSR
jgi:hypothetical protein